MAKQNGGICFKNVWHAWFGKLQCNNYCKSNTSMVSAHTSNAFATATVFSIVYGDKKWVSIVAYSAASLVGISRVYNNAHWLSDVMAGAAVGYLSIKGVNELYKLAGKKFSFMPEVSYHYYGMGITYALK